MSEFWNDAIIIDLQWFAAEDEGRTFDPTDTTYRKAREEGRVAKSQELVAAVGLLFPALVILVLAPSMLNTCAEMVRFFFTRATEMNVITDRVVFGVFINYFIRLAVPILIVGFVAGLVSNIVQVRFHFTTKPLTPDFSKVLPRFGRYFQKTLFSAEGLVNLAKSIVKMVVIGFIAYNLISSEINELANLQKTDLWRGITLIASLAARMLITAAVFLLVISIPDYVFQRWQFKQNLKMTREQFKEEQKQEEGDPQVRARLRSRYKELLSRNMLNNVPKADVVITNPTHYAVALEYDSERMIAPMVIAKGEDDLAFKIREIAEAHDVPVVSHPPLTRLLYKDTEIGETIPVRYYQVVISLLGHILRADKRNRTERMEKEA
ncbi:MAG: flagellar biosynthesis protein FlhB [Treponema sp.]|jgi:flagellar biosynthetic protein FlhB|nr:flagellar biosynthesis protein FlhB [Treponema sp.]